jgi:hypothetical protein
MKKSKRESDSCYFCGAAATSRDHLPPKTIFDDPKPTNLVTVQSCDLHNSQQSKDDEYFGVIVKTASAKNPVAEKLIFGGVVKRFLRRPKLLLSLLEKSRQVELRTPSGLIIGKAPAFEYDRSRISNVVTRMTRGFYFKFCGSRLPNNCSVKVFQINPKLPDTILGVMAAATIHVIVPHVFAYKFVQLPSDPYFSVWFFLFYDQTLIVSFTHKNTGGKSIQQAVLRRSLC